LKVERAGDQAAPLYKWCSLNLITKVASGDWTWVYVSRTGLARLIEKLRSLVPTTYPPTDTDCQARAPWRYRPGESMKAFSTRSEVVDEAVRRAAPRTSDAAICREIAKIADIDGLGWSAESIGSTRRKLRRT
jgi:hypothetical protein